MKAISSFVASSLLSTLSALLALYATGCTNGVPPDCGCNCPPSRPIEAATYTTERATIPNGGESSKSNSPHVDGSSFVLTISEDKTTYQLAYRKAGKRFVETWRARP